jgi:hypothetical protein
MLKNVELQSDPLIELMCSVDNSKVMPDLLETGVYLFEHVNHKYILGLADLEFEYQYPRIDFPAYGVCDTWEQLKAALPPVIFEPGRDFVITLAVIERAKQDPEGGWRYHKWGPYIGTQNPRHEYLYDDKHIDKVYCWWIYELP